MAGLVDNLSPIQAWRGRRSLDRLVERALAQPDGRVVELDASLAGWVRHGRLAGAGPFDLIVDPAPDAEREVRHFRESFLHLRPGGSYVVAGSSGESLSRFLEELSGSPLAEAVDHVSRDGGLLAVG